LKNYQSFLKLLNSQAKRTQIAIALVAALLGILIVTQLRANQTASQALQTASESDLSQIVGNLNNEINMLRAEAANLRLQLFKIERTSNDSASIMKESSKNLNNLKIIAGVTKVSGPGIKIQITDDNSSLNSYDLVDLITELRVGGAEAISINGIRIVARTGIMQDNRGIFIDQKPVSPPYEVLTIGEPEVLYEALVIAGGIRDKLTALSGVSFYITKENSVLIDSVAEPGKAK
jgi:uncharacterized protein YlxW (UPF0749 family)